MTYGLTRRSLIRGLGAAACALPALEVFGDGAQAQDNIPKRFVLMYGGMSTSRDGTAGSVLTPQNAGAGYDLRRSLLSLGGGALPYGGHGYDVQNDVSIVTGLEIPWGTGDDIPPGGKSVHFHGNTTDQQLTGVRRGPERRRGAPASSADILVADAIAGDTAHKHLCYRVQAARYITGGNSTEGGLNAASLRRREDGSLQRVEAISSPRLAYQSLFSGFVPDDGNRESAMRELVRRRNVLTGLRARTQSVMPRLGAADRRRLERHFDELNALQTRLESTPEIGAGACTIPMAPGEDPPLADGHELNNGSVRFTEGRGYSGETGRGNNMVDMVRMAFACDLSRSVGFRISLDQSFMNLEPAIGIGTEVHGATHGRGTPESTDDAVGWHVEFFARMVAGLRDTPAADGTSLLDHTAVVLLFEGGHGHDPESGGNNASHSSENMSALIGGRAGGLRGGVHIPTERAHPAQVVASAMQAVGMEDRLGEVEGRIPGLFR